MEHLFAFLVKEGHIVSNKSVGKSYVNTPHSSPCANLLRYGLLHRFGQKGLHIGQARQKEYGKVD
jgi:hypothetical protein